jgi:hypothetical protein
VAKRDRKHKVFGCNMNGYEIYTTEVYERR